MVYEDVSGFGPSLIQGFLRAELKTISEDQGLTFRREGSKEPLKTRPMVELSGHASDRLKDSIKGGRLLHVELINYRDKEPGLRRIQVHQVRAARPEPIDRQGTAARRSAEVHREIEGICTQKRL